MSAEPVVSGWYRQSKARRRHYFQPGKMLTRCTAFLFGPYFKYEPGIKKDDPGNCRTCIKLGAENSTYDHDEYAILTGDAGTV